MHAAFIVAVALTNPGDPLVIQDARCSALESAILSTTPSCMDESGPGYGHYVTAIQYAIFARRDIERWRFAPVYLPFGWPGHGGIHLGPDGLDATLQKAEYHLDKSDDPCR